MAAGFYAHLADLMELRTMVLTAAREGRATYLPAGARDNSTALVLVDGAIVGQASVVGHFVRAQQTSTFGECPLVPVPDFQLPARLRG